MNIGVILAGSSGCSGLFDGEEVADEEDCDGCDRYHVSERTVCVACLILRY